jgi:predicted nucleic acid-binding Zn ribbon protein
MNFSVSIYTILIMVSCKKCGAEVSENDKVCPECGTVQEAETSALMITIGFIIVVILVIWLFFSYFNILNYLMRGIS